MMELVLLSDDGKLSSLCEEILRELGVNDCRVVVAENPERLPAADLYIWDRHPEACFPAELASPETQKHLLLLERKYLESQAFTRRLPEVSIVLKPVTRAALRAFLGQACERWRRETESTDGRLGQLRADRDEMLQCLIQANLKLQEYDQDRTNFLARAVHDFRAPLTALSGYCGLLLGEQLGGLTGDQKEVIQRMQHSAKRLSVMANAMFQLSICQRLESKLNLQRADIHECIHQALHEMTPFSEDKRITISLDITPPLGTLAFEPSQMEQVLVNLLDNACKFTPKSGNIEIRGYPFFWERRTRTHAERAVDRRHSHSRTPNAFRVDIKDSGPGIPAHRLDRIFEEYTSYSGGQDRSGAGLGLAICRMIIQQHMGRVWAESNAKGAVFSFVLPYQRTEHLVEDGLIRQNTYHAGVI
jgi:signal transduction histidine kinase